MAIEELEHLNEPLARRLFCGFRERIPGAGERPVGAAAVNTPVLSYLVAPTPWEA